MCGRASISGANTDSIEPPPEALTGLSGHYLEGIATVGERMILILNLDAVLDLEYEVEPQISQQV